MTALGAKAGTVRGAVAIGLQEPEPGSYAAPSSAVLPAAQSAPGGQGGPRSPPTNTALPPTYAATGPLRGDSGESACRTQRCDPAEASGLAEPDSPAQPARASSRRRLSARTWIRRAASPGGSGCDVQARWSIGTAEPVDG